MQLHIPIDQLKWINENRQEKSQQTFIIQLIDKYIKNEILITEKLTEDQNDQEEYQQK